MIKYEFLNYDDFSERYLMSLKYVYELVIDPHRFGYFNKYNIFKHLNNVYNFEQSLFCCNDRYELKIWLNLNGFKLNQCKIFYNSDKEIEYASIILGK